VPQGISDWTERTSISSYFYRSEGNFTHLIPRVEMSAWCRQAAPAPWQVLCTMSRKGRFQPMTWITPLCCGGTGVASDDLTTRRPPAASQSADPARQLRLRSADVITGIGPSKTSKKGTL
jgi:hypothetical protein